MANTREEIREEVYYILGESSDSTEYTSTRLNDMINSYQDVIIKWWIKREDNSQTIKAPDLRFMRKKNFIEYVPVVSLTVDVVIWDLTIDFDTTDFQDSWYLNILWDVIQYTWKTATQVTWVTGIEIGKTTWDAVRQIYKLPTEAWKWFMLEFVDSNQVYSNYRWWYFLDYVDYRMEKDKVSFYTIIWDNETTTNQFIDIFWWNRKDDKFIFHYYKKATTMTADSDESNLPDDYGKLVIAPIVAWKILYNTDEVQKWVELLSKWYNEMETMYNAFANIIKEYQKWVKTRWFNLWSVN